jgi:hypothetical protein
MIGFLRRALTAFGIAAGVAGVLRAYTPEKAPSRQGGWRTLHSPSFR